MMSTRSPRWFSTCLLLAFLAFLPGHCAAQGGQGGFGGGVGGRIGEVGEGDAVSYKHILTPGDRGEWPLTVRAGETVIVFVTSVSFDPAAQIVDAAGRVLAENDNGAGGRNALLTALLKESGRYLLRVHSFGDGGSGPYRLRLRPNPLRPL